MLNQNKTYHRKKQILYDEDGNPILKFTDTEKDIENISGEYLNNLNKSIKLYPERIEIKNNVQLNLF